MTCIPCKVAFLKVLTLLEKLPAQEEPLRSEIRQVKEVLALAGYYIGEQELRLSKTGYKEQGS